MWRVAGLLPSRPLPRSSATVSTAPLSLTCRGQSETEFCFFECYLYGQMADIIRSAVLFLQHNRSRVCTSCAYRSARASIGLLNRAYSTVGPPAKRECSVAEQPEQHSGVARKPGFFRERHFGRDRGFGPARDFGLVRQREADIITGRREMRWFGPGRGVSPERGCNPDR